MSARLLLVEDEPALASLLARYLVRAGFSVVHCVSGADALRKWDESFALAVVDLGLPDMAGEELVERLLAATTTAPIIVSSGTPIEAASLAGRGLATRIHILQKPYLPGHLVEMIVQIGVLCR